MKMVATMSKCSWSDSDSGSGGGGDRVGGGC